MSILDQKLLAIQTTAAYFLGTKELGGYTASFQNKSYKTREEAKRAFKGDDYKQAFEIARSVYYK